jgi:hypothetical protein
MAKKGQCVCGHMRGEHLWTEGHLGYGKHARCIGCGKCACMEYHPGYASTHMRRGT